MLRIGLIGAGMVSRHHLIGWRGVRQSAQVVAIADPVPAHAEARASEFDIPRSFASAEAMIDALDLDAVDIVAPRQVHASLVRLAIDRGLAVMCQKPLAPDLAEAEALVRDVAGRGRLMIHENWRFRPYYRQIREWLEDGVVGEARLVQMALLNAGLLPDASGRSPALSRQPFMRDERRMLVNEVLIHHLDVLRFLLGPIEVLSATLGRYSASIIGEDTAIVHLRSESGALVTLSGCMALAGHPANAVDWFEIAGDRGAIKLDNHVLTRSDAAIGPLHYDPDQNYQMAYDLTIAHFVGALLSGAPFETGPEDNLHTLRLVEEIYRLAAMQRGSA